MKQQWRLFIGDFAVQSREEVVRIPVGQQQNEIAIVVIVKKLQAPPAHEFAGLADTGGKRHVVESFIMIVFINGVHFAVEVGYEQAHPSVVLKIGGIHAHAGSRPTGVAVGNSGSLGNFLEFSFAAIDEQKI